MHRGGATAANVTWKAVPVSRASLDKQPHEVAAMFDQVAERYDLTNDVLSLGQDRRWRRVVLSAVDPQPGERVLDLAAGTGTSSVPFALEGATVVPCDFSVGMLRVGKQARPRLPFVAGDATRLPFADATFDAVTISFGLAQRPRLPVVGSPRCCVSPGREAGSSCASSATPTNQQFRTVYSEYLMKALPAVARRVSSNPESLRLPRRVDPGLAGPAGARHRRSADPAGDRSSGATSPVGSSRCTGRPGR